MHWACGDLEKMVSIRGVFAQGEMNCHWSRQGQRVNMCEVTTKLIKWK